MSGGGAGRLAGKVALVTGGASGIGRATCLLFGQEGATVVIADIDAHAGRTVADEIERAGGHATFVRLDVAEEGDWRDVVAGLAAAPARLDIIVNNAARSGLLAYAAIEHVDLEAWNLVLASNATSVMLGMKHAVPLMRRSGGGSVVNVASIYAMVGSPRNTSYHASKGAVRALTRAAAVQLGDAGIRVNAVFPGFVDTPALAEALSRPEVRAERVGATPLGRIGRPDDVARGILYLASDESSFVTGAELVIDGGFTAR